MNEGYKISKLTLVWIMVFLVATCFFVTYNFTNKYWMVELVKRGHAKWVVTNDKGTVQWQWTESK